MSEADRLSPSIIDVARRLAGPRLYEHECGVVDALRLWGADTEFVTPARLSVRYTHTLLSVPPQLTREKDAIIAQREREARSAGHLFFDGPNTRLIDWRPDVSELAGSGREIPVIDLHFGPVSWYEYESLNEAFRRVASDGDAEQAYESYVGLSAMVSDGSVAHSQLSNILVDAVTIITRDAFAGYQERSARVSSRPRRLTSSVAENINRFLDDTRADDPMTPFHPDLDESSIARAGSEYEPRGVPHPFSAARRGLRDEISPLVSDRVNISNLKFVGLAFDLEILHPVALWAAFIDMTADEVLAARRRRPGKEYIEGSLSFTPASLDSRPTRDVLARDGWVPGGQASLLRTLELLEAVSQRKRSGFADAFRYLAMTG